MAPSLITHDCPLMLKGVLALIGRMEWDDGTMCQSSAKGSDQY